MEKYIHVDVSQKCEISISSHLNGLDFNIDVCIGDWIHCGGWKVRFMLDMQYTSIVCILFIDSCFFLWILVW